jgi:hypothetical protein
MGELEAPSYRPHSRRLQRKWWERARTKREEQLNQLEMLLAAFVLVAIGYAYHVFNL